MTERTIVTFKNLQNYSIDEIKEFQETLLNLSVEEMLQFIYEHCLELYIDAFCEYQNMNEAGLKPTASDSSHLSVMYGHAFGLVFVRDLLAEKEARGDYTQAEKEACYNTFHMLTGHIEDLLQCGHYPPLFAFIMGEPENTKISLCEALAMQAREHAELGKLRTKKQKIRAMDSPAINSPFVRTFLLQRGRTA